METGLRNNIILLKHWFSKCFSLIVFCVYNHMISCFLVLCVCKHFSIVLSIYGGFSSSLLLLLVLIF